MPSALDIMAYVEYASSDALASSGRGDGRAEAPLPESWVVVCLIGLRTANGFDAAISLVDREPLVYRLCLSARHAATAAAA